MAGWTLQDIRTKVRSVTGRFSNNELTNSELDAYINNYYVYTFPAEVKLDKEHTIYDFLTDENQAYYTVPLSTYTNFQPPAYANNLELFWYQDPAIFKQQNIQNYQFLTPFDGDGSTTNFTTTLTQVPIYPGSMTVYDGVETFEDTNTTWSTSTQTITGDLGGTMTLNYSTGAIDITFNTAPADGQQIYVNFIPFVAGRPTAILYYDSQFEVYPPPDQAYVISMKAYSVPSELSSPTSTPALQEWGPAIAYGAAKQILADKGEMELYGQVNALYREQINYILTRTCQNLLNTRSNPNF